MSSERGWLVAALAGARGGRVLYRCRREARGGGVMVTTGGLTLLFVVVGLAATGVWYFRAVRNGR